MTRSWAHGDWLDGLALSVIGTTLTALGLLLQKHAHNSHREEDDEKATMVSKTDDGSGSPFYFTRLRWLLAMGVYVAGSVVCWLGLGMGSQSVIACLNCWSMIVTMALAPLLLGERLSAQRVLGVLLLVSGCACVVAYGSHVVEEQTLSTLTNAWLAHRSLRVVLCVSVIFLTIAGATDCLGGDRGPDAAVGRRWWGRLDCFFRLRQVAVAAVFGWYSVSIAKCTSALVLTTLRSPSWQKNQLMLPGFWGLAVAQLLVIMGNVHYLNLGLQSGDALVIVPVYQSLSMVGQVLLGCLLFDELNEVAVAQQLRFWAGFAVVLCGVVCLASDAARGAEGGYGDEVLPLLGKVTTSLHVKHHRRYREGGAGTTFWASGIIRSVLRSEGPADEDDSDAAQKTT